MNRKFYTIMGGREGDRMWWRRYRILLIALAVVIVAGVIVGGTGLFRPPGPELNVLVWTGYEESEVLKPFEDRYRVKVNYKTFVGGDAMFSLLTQSTEVYDVVVVDPEYVQKLHALGRLQVLDPVEFDTADYLEPFRRFPLSWIDGKLYAPVVEFGANALVYNTKRITREEVSGYSILFESKVTGRIGVWDWYLPIMGVMSRSLGFERPYDINDGQFSQLKERLFKLRPQVRAIHSSFPEVISALANEDTWIVPGGAGWIAAILQQQGKPFDWAIPKEGGVLWVDTLAMPTDAPHPDLAKLYIKWMMSPEAQAALSQKRAYNSNVPNRRAYRLMSSGQLEGLKATSEQEMLDWLARLSVRTLPVRQPEKVWQDAWSQFKAGK